MGSIFATVYWAILSTQGSDQQVYREDQRECVVLVPWRGCSNWDPKEGHFSVFWFQASNRQKAPGRQWSHQRRLRWGSSHGKEHATTEFRLIMTSICLRWLTLTPRSIHVAGPQAALPVAEIAAQRVMNFRVCLPSWTALQHFTDDKNVHTLLQPQWEAWGQTFSLVRHQERCRFARQ